MQLSIASSLFIIGRLVSAETFAAQAAIDDCLSSAGVPVDSKGSTSWSQDSAPFNARLPYTPVALAVPTTVAQVQAAVSCGAKAGVKVTPKGGGHSYASFSLGGENGHLVVNLDRMKTVTLNKTTNIATIQAGARLGHVFNSLNSLGRAISHGTCPGVGISGHSLHGGFGFSSHAYGLAVDWIVGATVVLANATVVNTSATENPDLFWAIRGAGSNFGIVTSFLFNTFAPPSQTTVFSASLGWGSVSQAVQSWQNIQNFVQNTMPRQMNMRIFLNAYGPQLQGVYHGSSSALQSAIQPLGISVSASQTDWMGSFTSYSNGQSLESTAPYNEQENFYSKSLVTGALTTATMTSALNYWFNTARSRSGSWYLIIDMYGGKNAYIPTIPASNMSYAYRDKLFLYEFYDRPYGGLTFLDNWVNAFTNTMDTSNWGMYINYADPTMNRTYAQNVYWRQSLPRLQSIKAAVDPNDLFYYPQGVQPIAGATSS